MELQPLDSTWPKAVELVQRRIKVPSHIWNLIRNAWLGILSFEDFIRGLGFCAIDLQFLARAAEMDRIATSEQLAQAINRLGLRQATVAIAINYACLKGLKRGPQTRVWQNLYSDLMERVQIGSRLGMMVHELGTDAGMLAGFALRAGHVALMAEDPEAYQQLSKIESPGEFDSRSQELFGCTPAQLGSIIVQQLGFGAAASSGVLLAQLPHNAVIITNPETEMWQAACTWVHSLAENDEIPKEVKWRNFFPSLAGAEPSVSLGALLAEIRNARSLKRVATWHLPAASYEAADILVNGWKKATSGYKTVGGRRISISR